MMFLQPIWLILLLPLALVLALWRQPGRFLQVVRALVFLLTIIALARPALKIPSRDGSVLVLVDRSASMPPGAQADQKKAIEVLEKSMNSGDEIGIVSFGSRAYVEKPLNKDRFSEFNGIVGKDLSNLSEALDRALSLIPADSPSRILILSDGRWSGSDPSQAATRAAAAGVAIDYRTQQRSTAGDLGIDHIDAPDTVVPGESYLVTAWVKSPIRQQASVNLRKGTNVIAATMREFEPGLNRLMFRDRASEAGSLSYSLVVNTSEPDPIPENNRARFIVGVEGIRSMLTISNKKESGLHRLIQEGGLDVEHKQIEEVDWGLASLMNYSSILIENVTATDIGNTGLESLAAWVRQTGSGLMITGGGNSYGQGGYYNSALDPILPVTMELRQEHRKLKLGIVVALDRSGSMAAPVGGGKTKMDLADIGTANVYDLIGPSDELGVIAIDSAPHTVINLAPKSKLAASGARNKILKIESMGGGIYVYEALKAAVTMLNGSTAGTRHIILFSDARDSEEPGDYKRLIEKAVATGMTISVIGLGKDTDVDAALLKDIAKRGGGEIYFTENAHDIPQIFAQDTFSVARSTFIKDATDFDLTAAFQNLSPALKGKNPPELGGYNLCYVRPKADMAAVTTDEYTAPVVASWYAGSGRVLCYTGEADGEYAGDLAKWDSVGDFFCSQARWVSGERRTLPEELMLDHRVVNGNYRVELHLDPDRENDPFTEAPLVELLRGRSGITPLQLRGRMNWETADLLTYEVPMTGDDTVLASVKVAEYPVVTLSPTCLPYSEEFRPVQPGKGRESLQKLARMTVGRERVELTSIWDDLPRKAQFIDITPWLLLLAALLFLLEIIERRTGMLTRRDQRLTLDRSIPTTKEAKPIKHKKTRRERAVEKASAKEAAHAEREAVEARNRSAQTTRTSRPSLKSTPLKEGETGPNATLNALRKARENAKDRNQR